MLCQFTVRSQFDFAVIVIELQALLQFNGVAKFSLNHLAQILLGGCQLQAAQRIISA